MTRLRLLVILSALLCLGVSAQAQGSAPAQGEHVGWKELGGAALLAALGWWNRRATKAQDPILTDIAMGQTKLHEKVDALSIDQKEADERTTEELAAHGEAILSMKGDLVDVRATVKAQGEQIAANSIAIALVKGGRE